MLYGSVHVDPGAGWFPHFVGFAEEAGRGEGVGANVNLPLAPGTGDDGWLDAVGPARRCRRGATGPPPWSSRWGSTPRSTTPRAHSPVTRAGYREAGRLLGSLGLPTVAVQEGGYHLPTLGDLVVAGLAGLAEGHADTVGG